MTMAIILPWGCTLAGFGAGDITAAEATMAVTMAAGTTEGAAVIMAAGEAVAATVAVVASTINELPNPHPIFPPTTAETL